MKSAIAFVLACTLGHFALALPSEDEAGANKYWARATGCRRSALVIAYQLWCTLSRAKRA